jgi:heme o synthase
VTFVPAEIGDSVSVPRPSFRDFYALVKGRIVIMVLVTAATGFAVAAGERFDLLPFLSMLAGTALVAAGTNALNEYAERDLDRKMRRTANRPIPSGRMNERFALVFSLVISAAGIAILLFALNGLSAFLAFITLTSYLFAYTPLKQTTTWCTLVGAIPGAIPPMIGWAAARGELSAGAFALFALMFVWQMPHFFAISWMHREDYARAGFRMLSVGDENARRTTFQAVGFALLLIPVTLLPFALQIASERYAVAASLAVLAVAVMAVLFRLQRSDRAARRLFATTNIYLVAVMMLLAFGF